MPDSVTVTTKESWGSRLGNSLKGIVVGLVLFIAAFPLLFWNEGRSVSRAKDLKEGADAVVHADSAKLSPDLEGKLIHLNGKTASEGALADAQFGVAVSNALRLARRVEMYQWVESKQSKTTKKAGGSTETVTTYSYKKKWSAAPIPSEDFHTREGHENPEAWPVEGSVQYAQNVAVGAFALSENQIKGAGEEKPVPVPSRETALPQGLDSNIYSRTPRGFYVKVRTAAPAATTPAAAAPAATPAAPATTPAPAATTPAATPAPAAPAPATTPAAPATPAATPAATNPAPAAVPAVAADPRPVLPETGEPARAEVGDIRVTFEYAPDTEISLVGRQTGNAVTAFTTKNGGSILLQQNGTADAAAMFKTAEKANAFMTLLLRIIGFLMMFIGLKMILGPLSVLADVLPIAGSIVAAGAGIISLLTALAFSLATIGIAWLAYRPLIGIPTVVIACALLFIAVKKLKSAK